MLARVRARRPGVKYADPLHAGRHPFQTYILFLCVLSGVPLLFGEEPAARVEALLPSWIALTWAVCLVLGSVLSLLGSYWPRKNYATALTLERIGLDIVGPAALLYATLLAVFAATSDGGIWGSTVAVAVVGGFGLACLMRAGDLGAIIMRAIPDGDEDTS